MWRAAITTIAWDGKTLAADTRATAGGFPYSTVKAHKLADGRLYAGSGEAQQCQAVKNWLEFDGDKPLVKDFTGLVVWLDGRCLRYEDMLVPFVVRSPHAIGSGRDYAMAAMHLGKTAREAVELASLYDIYTGGPMTELSLTQDAESE